MFDPVTLAPNVFLVQGINLLIVFVCLVFFVRKVSVSESRQSTIRLVFLWPLVPVASILVLWGLPHYWDVLSLLRTFVAEYSGHLIYMASSAVAVLIATRLELRKIWVTLAGVTVGGLAFLPSMYVGLFLTCILGDCL